MANRLAQETSPYLLQHKDNPVDWYPWGEEALARAGAEAYRDRRDELEETATKLAESLSDQSSVPAPGHDDALRPDHLSAAAANLRRSADLDRGGFGGAPKFPQAMALDFCLRMGEKD